MERATSFLSVIDYIEISVPVACQILLLARIGKPRLTGLSFAFSRAAIILASIFAANTHNRREETKMAFLHPVRGTLLLLALQVLLVESFVLPSACGPHGSKSISRLEASRREIMSSAAFLPLIVAMPAQAGIDPSALRNLPVEGDAGGATMRLRQIDAVQRPESDLVNKPWEELANGVQYREYREGKGEAGEAVSMDPSEKRRLIL